MIAALRKALEVAGAQCELIGPTIGGVVLSDRTHLAVDQQLAGAPSVLYDAVALVVSEAGAAQLAGQPAARDFVADAVAHHKFVGHVAAAGPLLAAAGASPDGGFVALRRTTDAAAFLKACRSLRYWER